MLLYFILGIVFIYVFIPIVDNLLTIFSTWTEYISYIYAAKVYKIKQELNMQQEEEEESHNPIGFATEAIGFSTEEMMDPEQEELQQDDE